MSRLSIEAAGPCHLIFIPHGLSLQSSAASLQRSAQVFNVTTFGLHTAPSIKRLARQGTSRTPYRASLDIRT